MSEAACSVLGAVNDYFKNRGNISDADLGRYNVTGKAADRHVFKVPSLRMAALTPPYLHNGSAATLRDAVDVMFEFQLGREAPDGDKEAIVLFIQALVGESMDLSPRNPVRSFSLFEEFQQERLWFTPVPSSFEPEYPLPLPWRETPP